jgi:hypothetical protein
MPRFIAILLVLLALPLGAAAAPKPPFSLLTELKEICVKTKVEPKMIRDAARSRGYHWIRDGEYWIGDQRTSVNILVAKTGTDDFSELGPLDVMDCSLLVRPGREQDIEDVFRWLGLGKPPARQHFSLILDAFDGGGHNVLNGNTVGQVRALRQGSLRLVLLERLKGAVRIHYMSARPAEED